MRDLVTSALLSFSAIFFVVDPFAVLPIYLAMTGNENAERKAATALRASVASGLTLMVFAAAGSLIFKFFGITLGGFKIAGGILLFLVALDMVQARPSRTKTTPEEQEEGIEKADVAIIPLAIPLLAGPGAIATVMVLVAQGHGTSHLAAVLISIVVTSLATWGILRGASWLEARLSKTFLHVMTRVMGLILAAIAVEFVIAGLRAVLPKLTG